MKTIRAAHSGALLTIDLDAICDNWRLLSSHLKTAVCSAVVKADAYGLGAANVATALFKAGCRHFFVAHLDEGIHLRSTLPREVSVYVLHGPPRGTEGEFVAHGLIPVLNSSNQIYGWSAFARQGERAQPAVLQVDTGMSRLGLSLREFEDFANDTACQNGIELRYVMSHLASAELQECTSNAIQLDRFRSIRKLLPGVRASLSNSSGVFLGSEYHFDLARPGAALYGIAPVANAANPMYSVVRLQGKVIQVRAIEQGTGVGYGSSWLAPDIRRIATVSVGYADGFLRSLSNRGVAYYEGIPLPLVGTVSMDTITLDVTALPDGLLLPDALIDLIGEHHPVDAVAKDAGTIGYEILTSLGSRYYRRYIEEGRMSSAI